MNDALQPSTPPASTTVHHHPESTMKLYDSPLSGYYTDDTKSHDQNFALPMPSQTTQYILKRLNEVAAHVLRNDPSPRELDDLEHGLADLEVSLGMYGSTKTVSMPISALSDHNLLSFSHDSLLDDSVDLDVESPEQDSDINGGQACAQEPETALKIAHALLNRVSRANTELTARFNDLKDTNDRLSNQAEASAQAELELRSETESLKTGLVLDHSELLFLKLQLKALEVELQDSTDDQDEDEPRPALHSPRTKLRRISSGIKKWKSDWHDVDARLRDRRERCGIRLSSSPEIPGLLSSPRAALAREDGKAADDLGDWQLDMCKKRKGRVESIVIRRFDSPTHRAVESSDRDDHEHSESEDSSADSDSEDDQVQDDDPFVVKSETPTAQFCTRCARAIDEPEDEHEDDPVVPRVGPWRELVDSLAALTGANMDR